MKAQLARRLGIFGMAMMVALSVGGSSVAAQVPAGGIVSTNSPEYRQTVGQAAAQNAFNYYGQFGYGYNPYFYGIPSYGSQQFYYGGAPFYGGQQFYYGGQQFAYNVPSYNTFNYAYAPFYYGGTYYNTGFAIPDNFFTAVGCNVGNYSCFYNATR